MKKYRITKKIAAISVAFLLICALTGCGGNDSKNAQTYLSTWIEQVDLESEDTPEQLYQAALKEGTLVVYSETTRIYKVKESFEAKYPGLSVEVYDMRAHDIIKTLQNAYEKQEWLCDIVICSDDNAVLSSELLTSHIVNKYVPHDIAPFLQDAANQELLSFVGEAEQLFYNTKVYSECPVKNWWELTEPQWKGKVYMNSPLRSLPAYALVHSVIANSDKMAEAYEQLYGNSMTLYGIGECADITNDAELNEFLVKMNNTMGDYQTQRGFLCAATGWNSEADAAPSTAWQAHDFWYFAQLEKAPNEVFWHDMFEQLEECSVVLTNNCIWIENGYKWTIQDYFSRSVYQLFGRKDRNKFGRDLSWTGESNVVDNTYHWEYIPAFVLNDNIVTPLRTPRDNVKIYNFSSYILKT